MNRRARLLSTKKPFKYRKRGINRDPIEVINIKENIKDLVECAVFGIGERRIKACEAIKSKYLEVEEKVKEAFLKLRENPKWNSLLARRNAKNLLIKLGIKGEEELEPLIRDIEVAEELGLPFYYR